MCAFRRWRTLLGGEIAVSRLSSRRLGGLVRGWMPGLKPPTAPIRPGPMPSRRRSWAGVTASTRWGSGVPPRAWTPATWRPSAPSPCPGITSIQGWRNAGWLRTCAMPWRRPWCRTAPLRAAAAAGSAAPSWATTWWSPRLRFRSPFPSVLPPASGSNACASALPRRVPWLCSVTWIWCA